MATMRTHPTVGAADGPLDVTASGEVTPGSRTARLQLARDLALGTVAPALVTVGLSRADQPNDYRPGMVLLALVVGLAYFVGLRAAAIATASSTVAVWWAFTDRQGALASGDWGSAVSVAIFVVTSCGVLAIVSRRERERTRALREEGITATLMAEAPIGIGLFDRGMRATRHNARFAESGGPRTGPPEPAYQPLVTQVLSTGRPVVDHLVSSEPMTGPEWHWRVSCYPVTDRRSRLIGVGSITVDVTADVIGRRRSESLLRLANELAAVSDEDALAERLANFLAGAFASRAMVALVDPGASTYEVRGPLAGYSDATADAVDSVPPQPIDAGSPLGEALHRRSIVTVADTAADSLHPEWSDDWVTTGDLACACVPVADPTDPSRMVAAFRVGWPHERELTDASRTLCETVASLVGLALNRIRLAEEVSRDRFRRILDTMHENVTIASSLRDDEGKLVDFRIEFVNAASLDGAGRGPGGMIGRRVLELYPAWAESGMFERFVGVVETGQPFLIERLAYKDELADGSRIEGHWNLQVVPFDDGYVAASRDVSEIVRLEETERRAEITAAREQVAMEMLQQAALPASVDVGRSAAVGALYQPAAEGQPVGGDWFDVFTLSDGRLGFVIADVAGHGPEAAGFMVQVRNFVRAVAAELGAPGEVLGRVNTVALDLGPEHPPFITCCYAVFDPVTLDLEWASAGHLPPLHASRGDANLLFDRPGAPLALYPDVHYKTHVRPLAPGDRLVLYTDGLVERRGESIDDGLQRLVESVVALCDAPAQAAADTLGATVGNGFDDLALLVIDVPPES